MIDRRGAADRIAADLREDILGGALSAGTPLRETELAARYSVARNTIRESLRLLCSEGLALHEVHRGVAVRSFTAADIAELFEVRGALESLVSSRVGALSAEERAGLVAPLDRSEEAAAAGDFRLVLELNLLFHRELVVLVGNHRLTSLFDGLVDEIRLILASLEADVAGPWLARNRELLRLVDGNDPARFIQAILDYIATSREDLIARRAERSPRVGGDG